MTAGNNGTPEPENDDPFAHLYRGQGDQAAAPGARPGVPRTSYHQVSRVGERRQAPGQQGGYGYPQAPTQAQTQAYGRPVQESPQPGYDAPPPRAGHGRGRGGGSNQRGLMYGAIAVVAVVVIGITAAVMSSDGSKGQAGAGSSSGPTGSSTAPSNTSTSDPMANLPQNFAANLTLSGGAKTNSDHAGSQNAGGLFVDGMGTPGATATWTLTVPKSGSYTLWVRYANADKNKAQATVAANGKPLAWKLNLNDYVGDGNWDHWFTSYVTVNLKQGTNSVALSCSPGDICNFNLDRVGLSPDAGSGTPAKPKGWS